MFNDVILELSTGFRQQRLKLIGWKTDNWSGDFFAPGFVFDNAKVSAWTANTDYLLGDNVEYNAKFYVAKVNHNSGTKFDIEVWTKKDKKPEAKLYPNFDYRISQFNDYYGLETNNFDSAQEKLAQHLTGYQSRDYLENFDGEISILTLSPRRQRILFLRNLPLACAKTVCPFSSFTLNCAFFNNSIISPENSSVSSFVSFNFSFLF